MSAKTILVFCAQALLVKSVLSSCIVTCTRPVSSVLVYDNLAAPMVYEGPTGWGGGELTYDGLSAPLVYDGLASWSDRGLAYESLATPMAYEGLAGWDGRELAYDGLAAPMVYEGLARGLVYDGLAAPLANDALAGWGGRELAYNGLAAPIPYEGLAGWGGRSLAYDTLAAPLAYNRPSWTGRTLAPAIDVTPTSGGALPVSSGSPIAPVGISLKSDNAYEGILEVVGELPFVGTVALEGVLPTEGAGAVNHACGNGDSYMVSEDAVFVPEYIGAAIAPAAAYSPGPGYRAGWARRGVI